MRVVFKSNAINYTEHGGITINLSSDAKRALIAIRDTGIGVD